jgi:hypothetical protein
MSSDLYKINIECSVRKSDTGTWIAELTGCGQPMFFSGDSPLEAIKQMLEFVAKELGEDTSQEIAKAFMKLAQERIYE